MAHQVYRWLFPILWTGWAFAWMALAFRTKRVVWRESGRSRASHIVPLAIGWVGLTLTAPDDQFWFHPLFGMSPVPFWSGALFAILGFALTFWARFHLAGNWSGTVTLKQDHELITSGPYHLVRHPIYTGLLLAIAGTALARNDLRALACFLLILVALHRKSLIEERKLAEHFGQAYLDYRKRSRTLIPYLL